jgi:hypothetical protein
MWRQREREMETRVVAREREIGEAGEQRHKRDDLVSGGGERERVRGRKKVRF